MCTNRGKIEILKRAVEKMKTLPINASDEEIKTLIIEWNELLAQEKYEEAIDFILYENTKVVDGEIWIWTPEKLEAAVYTYGMPWYSKEEYEAEYGEGAADLKVASLLHSPNSKELLDKISFEINYYTVSAERAELWGISNTDYENIMGDVLYDGVPLNDWNSDLTAIFYLKKIDENHMTLCFQDLHVM